MSRLVDQYGNPFKSEALDEPQTSRIAALENQYLTPMLGGLTPARLASIMRDADNGSLIDQHRLFADMEERDGHIQAEMDKRKNAVSGLSWSIVPPRNASAEEKKMAEWVAEILTDAIDPLEDLILSLMEAVGHGFAATELEWRQEGKYRLPVYHPQPQEFFTLDESRTSLRLRDGQPFGADLNPFGWIVHTPKKPKTGYGGRLGLYRTLAWPFLYKAYAVGDLAEFLETYGLPIIVGKYFNGASGDEKNSLMRAVQALGHDARAIMPAEMSLEIKDVAAKGGADAHMSMMNWADKSQSKSILGQTLSADTGEGGGGSYALGKVHNEVRHDICRNDARQVSATLTRDLVYPILAVNRPGVQGLSRCPNLVINTSTPEDMKLFADALPKLVNVGFQVPRAWAQERVHIPLPEEGEEVLAAPAPRATEPKPSGADTAALSATIPESSAPPAGSASLASAVDQLEAAAAPQWMGQIARLQQLVNDATSLEALQASLVEAYGGTDQTELQRVMAAAFALAELAGMADVAGGD